MKSHTWTLTQAQGTVLSVLNEFAHLITIKAKYEMSALPLLMWGNQGRMLGDFAWGHMSISG